MRDLVQELHGIAIGKAANSLLRITLVDAAKEIEKLRKIQKRLNDLATSAAGHISNKGIADDFRKNIALCQVVDL